MGQTTIQKSRTKKTENTRMTFKEILAEQWFLTKLCFKTSPKGMALHVFESMKLQVSIFFESVLTVNYVIGVVERGESWHKLFWCIAIFMLAVALSTVTFAYYSHSVLPKLKPVLYQAFRMHIYERTKDMDLACYSDTDFYQKFILATEESDACIDRYLESVELYSAYGLKLLISILYCLIVNPVLLLVPVLLLPLDLWLSEKENKYSVASRMERLPYEQKREYQNRIFYLADYAKDLRLNPNMQAKCQQDFHIYNNDIRHVHKQYGKKLFLYGFIHESILVNYLQDVLNWSLLLYQLLVLHTLSYAHMLSSLKASLYVSDSLKILLLNWKKIMENSAYVRQIRSLTNRKPTIISQKNLPVPENLEASDIQLSHVSFSYHPGAPVLKDISLHIHPKQKIALVGYNGSGKTTLIKLLLRLYDPDSGSISVGGTDIKNYDVTAYRHSIGSVFQDFKIYAASLKENVLLDVSDHTKKERYEIEKALYDTHFTLQDNRLVYQVETPLTTEFEKDGVNLSGGEMQKVAIARTLYRKQNICIMDEPSSALDPLAEYQLNQEMNEIAKDKTVIFISHRLSTTRDADCIYMMEHGRMIESGTHEELLAMGGKYAKMWEVQASLYCSTGKAPGRS